MIYIVYTIHVLICLFLIMVVLLQQGSGADLSVFGGGGTQTAFGARSATNLLHKLTVAGFVGFILTTIAIGFLKTGSGSSVMTEVEQAAPVAIEEGETLPVSDDGAGAGAGEAPVESGTNEGVGNDSPPASEEAGSTGEDAGSEESGGP